jgi:hypothetical protein
MKLLPKFIEGMLRAFGVKMPLFKLSVRTADTATRIVRKPPGKMSKNTAKFGHNYEKRGQNTGADCTQHCMFLIYYVFDDARVNRVYCGILRLCAMSRDTEIKDGGKPNRKYFYLPSYYR